MAPPSAVARWLALVALAAAAAAPPAAAQTLTEFTASMYPTVLPAYPCTKLLNRTGAIGCENSVPQVLAPMELLRSAAALAERAEQPTAAGDEPMLVLPYDVFADDATFDAVDRIAPAGILVLAPESGPLPPHFSPAEQDPQHPTGLYGASGPDARDEYPWNPNGTGISHRFFRYPIWLIGRTAAADVVARCEESEAQAEKFPRWAAKTILTMQAQTNSLECLDANSCMPLTGQSVLSVLGPRTTPEIILATAALDSTSFFHGDWTSRADQLSPGGGAEIAGAIAAVAAARALRGVAGALTTPVAFAIFSAESWGRVGSRHLAACTWPPTNPPNPNTCPVTLPDMTSIREVIGIGGISEETESNQFYAHIDPAAPGQAAAATVIQAQLVAADPNLTASTTEPQRLPTSSAETFARLFNTTALVIAGHDTAFTNRFYHSELDRRNNAQPDTVCSLATTLARSLHILGGAPGGTSTLEADCAFVAELIECTLGDFGCALAKELLGTADVDGTPPHYVFIRRDPSTVSPLEAFFYSLMARESAVSTSSHECSSDQDCRDAGIGEATPTELRLCVAGTCLVSDTRYIDAHSNALDFDGNQGRWVVTEGDLEPDEPLWTESDWHSDLGVTLFLQDDPALERRVLLAGVGWGVVCVAAVAVWSMLFDRRSKTD
eukprot:COSAG06_NODE_99_length_24156_cov_20.889549_23_plen_667_part_00